MASSKRQKRQSIRRGAHELKNKPGWDPTNFEREDPLERLRDLNQQERTEASFEAASQCPDCQMKPPRPVGPMHFVRHTLPRSWVSDAPRNLPFARSQS